MKKRILIIALVLLTIACLFYVLIPKNISYQYISSVHANGQFCLRNLSSGEFLTKAGVNSFSLEGPLANEFRVMDTGRKIIGRLQVIERFPDSARFVWLVQTNTTENLPWHRWENYKLASARQSKLKQMSAALTIALEQKERTIKDQIKLVTQQDSFFISKKFTSTTYPSTETLYTESDLLKSYASDHSVKPTDPFIYNVRFSDRQYENMIAIPIDREIPETRDFSMKRMISVNILKMEVRGGEFSVRQAFDDLENYVRDRRYKSPAIPFIQPITDRRQEQDSARWVTNLYYPVY